MMTEFLPALLGGLLIGLASGSLYYLMGEIAGISGIVRRAFYGPARNWRLYFLGGMLTAGLLWGLFGGVSAAAGLSEQHVARLVVAGLFVGVGTYIGNGCTSGHGVCGLSRLSKRSLVAVLVFMATAALTVLLMRHGGLL